MIRSRRWHAWIARLALVAILLAALVPTVSRVLASGSPRLPAALTAMCTSSSPSWLHPESLLESGKKLPTPPGAMQDEYCAYCPLLAAVAPLLFAVIAWWSMRPSRRQAEGHAPPWRRAIAPRGLGARGPPILL